jgi:hypothetical protein
MKMATVKEIKSSLANATIDELVAYCLQLARFKKENKELLTYLLYEASDELQYINNVKYHLDELFETVNTTQLYFAKKTIRKIIRLANQYIKYSKLPVTTIEIHLHVAEKIKALQLPLTQNKTLFNMYTTLLKKIKETLASMHEDEQYDYSKRIQEL